LGTIWLAIKTRLCNRPFVWFWLPPLLWMIFIFALSAQPQLPQAPSSLADLLIKKSGHMAEYAILALLLRRALMARAARLRPQWIAWLLTLLYAVLDEFHQTFVPGRNGQLLDVIIDGMGASLAALGAWLVTRGEDEVSEAK
jgi:VanZ family protein